MNTTSNTSKPTNGNYYYVSQPLDKLSHIKLPFSLSDDEDNDGGGDGRTNRQDLEGNSSMPQAHFHNSFTTLSNQLHADGSDLNELENPQRMQHPNTPETNPLQPHNLQIQPLLLGAKHGIVRKRPTAAENSTISDVTSMDRFSVADSFGISSYCDIRSRSGSMDRDGMMFDLHNINTGQNAYLNQSFTLLTHHQSANHSFNSTHFTQQQQQQQQQHRHPSILNQPQTSLLSQSTSSIIFHADRDTLQRQNQDADWSRPNASPNPHSSNFHTAAPLLLQTTSVPFHSQFSPPDIQHLIQQPLQTQQSQHPIHQFTQHNQTMTNSSSPHQLPSTTPTTPSNPTDRIQQQQQQQHVLPSHQQASHSQQHVGQERFESQGSPCNDGNGGNMISRPATSTQQSPPHQLDPIFSIRSNPQQPHNFSIFSNSKQRRGSANPNENSNYSHHSLTTTNTSLLFHQQASLLHQHQHDQQQQQQQQYARAGSAAVIETNSSTISQSRPDRLTNRSHTSNSFDFGSKYDSLDMGMEELDTTHFNAVPLSFHQTSPQRTQFASPKRSHSTSQALLTIDKITRQASHQRKPIAKPTTLQPMDEGNWEDLSTIQHDIVAAVTAVQDEGEDDVDQTESLNQSISNISIDPQIQVHQQQVSQTNPTSSPQLLDISTFQTGPPQTSSAEHSSETIDIFPAHEAIGQSTDQYNNMMNQISPNQSRSKSPSQPTSSSENTPLTLPRLITPKQQQQGLQNDAIQADHQHDLPLNQQRNLIKRRRGPLPPSQLFPANNQNLVLSQTASNQNPQHNAQSTLSPTLPDPVTNLLGSIHQIFSANGIQIPSNPTADATSQHVSHHHQNPPNPPQLCSSCVSETVDTSCTCGAHVSAQQTRPPAVYEDADLQLRLSMPSTHRLDSTDTLRDSSGSLLCDAQRDSMNTTDSRASFQARVSIPVDLPTEERPRNNHHRNHHSQIMRGKHHRTPPYTSLSLVQLPSTQPSSRHLPQYPQHPLSSLDPPSSYQPQITPLLAQVSHNQPNPSSLSQPGQSIQNDNDRCAKFLISARLNLDAVTPPSQLQNATSTQISRSISASSSSSSSSSSSRTSSIMGQPGVKLNSQHMQSGLNHQLQSNTAQLNTGFSTLSHHQSPIPIKQSTPSHSLESGVHSMGDDSQKGFQSNSEGDQGDSFRTNHQYQSPNLISTNLSNLQGTDLATTCGQTTSRIGQAFEYRSTTSSSHISTSQHDTHDAGFHPQEQDCFICSPSQLLHCSHPPFDQGSSNISTQSNGAAERRDSMRTLDHHLINTFQDFSMTPQQDQHHSSSMSIQQAQAKKAQCRTYTQQSMVPQIATGAPPNQPLIALEPHLQQPPQQSHQPPAHKLYQFHSTMNTPQFYQQHGTNVPRSLNHTPHNHIPFHHTTSNNPASSTSTLSDSSEVYTTSTNPALLSPPDLYLDAVERPQSFILNPPRMASHSVHVYAPYPQNHPPHSQQSQLTPNPPTSRHSTTELQIQTDSVANISMQGRSLDSFIRSDLHFAPPPSTSHSSSAAPSTTSPSFQLHPNQHSSYPTTTPSSLRLSQTSIPSQHISESVNVNVTTLQSMHSPQPQFLPNIPSSTVDTQSITAYPISDQQDIDPSRAAAITLFEQEFNKAYSQRYRKKKGKNHSTSSYSGNSTSTTSSNSRTHQAQPQP